MRPVSRPDPAPSRLAYRMHRMWLTPAFWLFLRFGLPMIALTALAVWAFASEDRRMAIYDWGQDLRRQIEQRPEFMVNLLAIDGASDPVARVIREGLPVHLPASSFDLDLAALQSEVQKIPAVADAEVHVRSGGVLEVVVTERVPVALWRGPDGLRLLSRDGIVVGAVERRAQRADLPLLAGAGAERAVGEALEVMATAAPLRDRLRGLLRVGERRWDVVLDRDQIIQLPSHNPEAALARVIVLDDAQDLLDRDIAVVDFRNRDRETVRLTDNAVAALRAIRIIETGASQQ